MWLELNLLKRGLVSIDQMLSAVKRQQLGRVPIGRIAIEHGKMSMSHVVAVLKEQADKPCACSHKSGLSGDVVSVRRI